MLTNRSISGRGLWSGDFCVAVAGILRMLYFYVWSGFLQVRYRSTIADPSGDATAYVVDASVAHFLGQMARQCTGAIAGTSDQDHRIILVHGTAEMGQKICQHASAGIHKGQ